MKQISGKDQLLVIAREDNYIYAIDLKTFERQRFNMNANGDDFVSFNALDIHVSNDQRLAVVATGVGICSNIIILMLIFRQMSIDSFHIATIRTNP